MPKMNLPPLPAWVDHNRLSEQQHVVSDIVDRFLGRNGHPVNDVVFLQAPTGTGKTLIAELIRRQMMAKTLYVCSTKALQNQFVRDFPYAKVLKGRSNYLTLAGPVDEMGNPTDRHEDRITYLDCTWDSDNRVCRWCDDCRSDCPYIRARGNASASPLAVLNTSYLLTDSIGPQRFTKRDLVVVDEADMLEHELLSKAELKITNRRMKRLGLTPPKYKTKPETWAEWITDHVLPKAEDYVKTLPRMEHANVKQLREIKYMDQLVDQLDYVAKTVGERWVYDGYKGRDYEGGDIIFRPIFVAGYGDQLLFQHHKKLLLMSATILAPDVMASELGLTLAEGREYDAVDVPSNFPVENRPIHVVPIAEMTHANMEESKPKMAQAIAGVLIRHPDDRILVHCVSYDLANYLQWRLSNPDGDCIRTSFRRPLLSYSNSGDKDRALEAFKEGDSSVLFAPSMDRGIDLPDDLCRVQVIAKVPYPNLGDKRVNGRLYTMGGQAWYAMHTVRTIVQMVGRAVRHRNDYAITYILDTQFSGNIYKDNKNMFPKYFRDALNFRFNPRLLTEAQE